MRLNGHVYNGLATVDDPDAEIRGIMGDHATYTWIYKVAHEAMQHDPVDAMASLEALADAFKRRNSCIHEAAVRLQQPIELDLG